MVRAVLDGSKTETRRPVRGKALEFIAPGMFAPGFAADPGNMLSPFGYAGDVLYVRERFCTPDGGRTLYAADWPDDLLDQEKALRRAYPDLARAFPDSKWRPSIHMPKAVARLWLRVLEVRIERLQDITDAGAQAEGASDPTTAYEGLRYMGGGTWASAGLPSYEAGLAPSYRASFASSWDSIYQGEADTWHGNPWVWVVRFDQCGAPDLT